MCHNRGEGERCVQRRLSPEAGEEGDAPADFDGDKRFRAHGGGSNRGGGVEEDCPRAIAWTSGSGEGDLEEGADGLN
jgi:hypothetical protein